MKKIFLIIFFLTFPTISKSSIYSDFNPFSLIFKKEGKYIQLSSHNKILNGLGDFVSIRSGEKYTLCKIEDCGIITNFWLTISEKKDKNYLRKIILRMFWDGEENPSVEAPVGDFFGVGFSKYIHYTSLLLGMSSGGFYSYFPMPFEKSAKIEITNLSDETIELWFSIGYQKLKKLPKNVLKFHAKFRREKKTKRGENYLILEAKGKGNFAGCVLSMQGYRKNYLMFLEGDEIIYVDDEKEPSILGTGTEDYFLSGFYFNQGIFAGPLHGCLIKDKENSMISAYRFRIQDAISFNKSIRVEIEHGITKGMDVNADYSSVAYWYQTEPHYEFYKFPEDISELLPIYKINE